ncbi:MAG: tetratricopeptide repeat protein [Chloroflexi bacterium]|nr:tetratricopeptide repeat protein [Chloroflexota bacterium]
MITSTNRRPQLLMLIAVTALVTTILTQAINRYPIDVPGPSNDRPAPTTPSAIAQLQDRLRGNPDDVQAYAQLGLLLLQRVRETGDASLYAAAQQAFDAALRRAPDQLDAILGIGSMALARHQFYEALEWGEVARSINPYRAQVYGVIGDAQIELGLYDQAATTFQKMIDTRPDIASYSRVSYLRELHGDMAGAIEAMQRAVAAGYPSGEGTLWAQVQLGNLYFNRGDLAQAEATYQRALSVRSDYVYAQAGIARVRAAQGNFDEAIRTYQMLVDVLPLPEFVVTLGDLYEVTGQLDQARRQHDLVGALQQLQASAGVDVDLELALFHLDHGIDLAASLDRARAAYGRRPTIHAADVVAWALYQNGHYAEARRFSREALRLGTRDALLHFHTGLIELARDNRAAARQHLEQAMLINPHFSIRHASSARELLERLSTPALAHGR